MLDLKTGHFTIDDKHRITPESSLATIETWQLGASQKARNTGNGWNWVDIKNLLIDDLYFNISLLFHGQRIRGFTMVFQNKPYELNPSWASWSEEKEKSNLLRFNKWLDEQVGEERELAWGSVRAFYDARSGGSSIKLRYC